MSRFTFAVSIALFLSPFACFAATGETVTGSGSESQALVEERKARAENLVENHLAFRKSDREYRDTLAEFYKKRAEARRKCREDLRRANKDARVPTVLRCYGAELTMEGELLTARKDHITALPGLADAIRTQTLGRLDLLSQAIKTITYAMNKGVYETMDDVSEAKTNLLQKYRRPFWDGLALMRVDRTLSWLASLIIDLDAAKDELTASGATIESIATARTCLAEQEAALRTLLASPPSEIPAKLPASLAEAQSCLPLLKNLGKPPSSSSSASGY